MTLVDILVELLHLHGIHHRRDIGIEVEFMNPLTEMMGKLSTNIITKE